MRKNKDKSLSTKATELRSRAEEQLQLKTSELYPLRTEDETRRLLHELEVHQIELEMQNTELRQAQEYLEKSRNKYAELYDFAPIGYFTFDSGGLIQEVNLAGAQLLGIERHLLVNTPFSSFISNADEREFFFRHLASVLKEEGMQRCEISMTNKGGTKIHGQLQSVAVDTIENNTGLILTSIIDGTVSRLAAERISEILRQQQAILDNIPDITWLKNRKGTYVAVNDPFCRACDLATKDLIGKNDHDIYPPGRAVKYENDCREVIATGTRTYFEESTVDLEGNALYLEKVITPIFNDSGVAIGVIGIVRDITNRKEVEAKLLHENSHDIMTGLYNRAFFDTELNRLSRSRMFPMSIVMADINGLKIVNDSQGHEAGDDLIRLAARIILRAFRAEDIVARIGGDEFGVILPETTTAVAEEAVRKILSYPEIINHQVSIAFGIASAENKDQVAEAIKLSDVRMYRDKSDTMQLQPKAKL